MHLESEELENKNKKISITNYGSIVQHEFKAPLATSITFLETLLHLEIPNLARQHVRLVISQMHMQLNLVYNLMDCKAIQERCFIP